VFILWKSGHGKRNPSHVRRAKYPAYGHKCKLCQRDHHFEQVCRSKDKPQPPRRLNREQGQNTHRPRTLCLTHFATHLTDQYLT